MLIRWEVVCYLFLQGGRSRLGLVMLGGRLIAGIYDGIMLFYDLWLNDRHNLLMI